MYLRFCPSCGPTDPFPKILRRDLEGFVCTHYQYSYLGTTPAMKSDRSGPSENLLVYVRLRFMLLFFCSVEFTSGFEEAVLKAHL